MNRRWLMTLMVGGLIMANAENTQGGAFLGDLTWQQAELELPGKVVILPFAAGAKEHGPHLPLRTDQLVMDRLLEAAVDQRDVIVAPPILHGWFPAFRDYPGTEVADAAVFQNYVAAVAESLVRHGARRLVFLNTGISKASGLPLSIVARDIRANHDVATLVVSWDDLESPGNESIYEQLRGGHADEGETSIVLHLRDDLVRMDLAEADYRGSPSEQIGYAPGKFDRDSESGVFGDPTLATPQKGEVLMNGMIENFLLALDQFSD
jgi:creatinine amidohydrolase